MIRRRRRLPGESDAMRQVREMIARPSEFIPRSTVIPSTPQEEPIPIERATALRVAALRIVRNGDGG